MSEIYSIVYQPRDQRYGEDRFSDFIRVPLQEANLLTDYGIEGDRKAGRQPHRQLNILSYEWLESLAPLGYQIEPGAFGEQIILKGLSFEDLARRDLLRLGDEALVEIIMPRTTCIRLEAAQGVSNAHIDNEAGLMARVLRGGVIRVGDRVEVVENAEVNSEQ